MRFVRMLTSVAIVVGLALSLSGEANASSVYGYARQELTNFDINSSAVISVSTALNTSTFNTATVSGFPASVVPGGLDALQAYSGVGPAPAQNSFVPKGQIPPPNWARGDSVINVAPVINGVNGDMRNVAEGNISTLGNGDGLGQWSLSYEFDALSTGDITMTTNWANELRAEVVATLAGANATAAYSLTVNLLCTSGGCGATPNQSGAFGANDLNDSTSQNGPGSGVSQIGPASGVSSLIAPLNMQAGRHYILTISADEHISLADVAPPAAVPEPGTWMLMGTGLLGLLGYGWRRKRTA